MGDGLHIFYIILEPDQIAETEHGEHLDSRFLLADELRLDFLEAQMAGDADDFAYQGASQATSTILRMHQHTNAANVAFPAAKLLMEGDIANDLVVHESKEGQIAAKIYILAPVADDGQFGYAMLDKHPFRLRDRQEKFMKSLLIVLAQWTEFALQ